MLISHGFLKLILAANDWHPLTTGSLLQYNKDLELVEIKKARYVKNGYIIRWGLLYSTAAALFYRILISSSLSRKSSDDSSNSATIVANMCMLPFAACLITGEAYRVRGSYPEEMVEFLNSGMQLERKYAKDVSIEKSAKIKLAKLVCKLTHLTCHWMSKSMAIVSCINPGVSVNLVWIFVEFFHKIECSATWFSTTIRGFVFLGNYVIWEHMTGMGYCMIAEILVGSLSLQYYQNLILRRFQNILTGKFGFDGTQEWLQNEMIAFRALQLVVSRFNTAMRTILFGCLLTAGVIQIVSVLMLINLMIPGAGKIPVYLTIFFMACVVESALVILVCFGFAGDFYQDSVNSEKKLNKMVKYRMTRMTYHRRHTEAFFRSCRPNRIHFGLSNFIEKQTPLVFQMFCVLRIIDMLLLKK